MGYHENAKPEFGENVVETFCTYVCHVYVCKYKLVVYITNWFWCDSERTVAITINFGFSCCSVKLKMQTSLVSFNNKNSN